MTTKEALKPCLTREIRERLLLNRSLGDEEGNQKNSTGIRGWRVYGSEVSNYNKSFREVLNGHSLSSLLKNKKRAVIIDLMGPSDTIADLFEKFYKKSRYGLAVSLGDLRNDEQIKRDKRLNIVQIAEDIIKSSTWDEIEEKLDDRKAKADLIMERALAGLAWLPQDPRFLAMLLNKAWELLSEDSGILIAEVPSRFQPEAKKMIEGFRKNYNMNASAAKSDYDGGLYIKLVKTPNSPEKLPF